MSSGGTRGKKEKHVNLSRNRDMDLNIPGGKGPGTKWEGQSTN